MDKHARKALLTAAVGVGHVPGTIGWLGNAMVAGGTFAVIYQDGKGKGASSSGGAH